MALKPYEEDNEVSTNPIKSAPAKRLRWATQRAGAAEGKQKRNSILRRLSRRSRPSQRDSKRESTGTEPTQDGSEDGAAAEETGPGRRIFFNKPLPDDARDEEGHPTTQFVRNKIRTAKYTPISFVPKNLYFQFHNIANIYFLFIIILCVSLHRARKCSPFPADLEYRSSPSLVHLTRD